MEIVGMKVTVSENLKIDKSTPLLKFSLFILYQNLSLQHNIINDIFKYPRYFGSVGIFLFFFFRKVTSNLVFMFRWVFQQHISFRCFPFFRSNIVLIHRLMLFRLKSCFVQVSIKCTIFFFLCFLFCRLDV